MMVVRIGKLTDSRSSFKFIFGVLFIAALFLPQVRGSDINHYVLTENDLVSAGFKDVRAGVGTSSVTQTRYHKIFYFKYVGPSNPGGTVIADFHMNICSSSALGGCPDGDTVQRGKNVLVCTSITSPYREYLYFKNVQYTYVFNADHCDSGTCESDSCNLIVLVLHYYASYNVSSPDPYINALNQRMISKISTPKSDMSITIKSPGQGEVFYYEPGKGLTISIKAVPSGEYDYVGAHYEAHGVMLGGEMSVVNGVAERTIHLASDEIFPQATVSAYVKKGDDEKEDEVTIYFKPKASAGQTQPKKHEADTESGETKKLMKIYHKSEQRLRGNKKKLEVVSSNVRKIASIIDAETMTLKTPGGNAVKIVQDDHEIEKSHPNVKKGTGLWFKLKYGFNKYVSNPLIDVIASKIPIAGAYKDYFKDDKDTNVFDNDVEKTARDLNVDRKSASLYNQMSGVEDREKSLSVSKNTLASVPAVGKPMEFAVDAMTMGTKKIIARYYHKEYNYVVKQAKFYRSHGMKWKDVHNRIKEDLEDLEGGFTGMSSAEENAASQYLNTMSKGQYKDIKARADLYILQAMENGELK